MDAIFPEDPHIEAGGWIEEIPVQSGSSKVIYGRIKRFTDLTLVLMAAPVVIILGVLVALLVYLEDGQPIFFSQKRTGLGGRRFKMYKFRTMVVNAEEMLQELAAQGLAKLDANGKLAEPLKLERDPRITRIGRILRKTSLDEIPQLFNIFRGDMSLVGPRPTSWDLESYNLFQTERLSVRPGLTGLWQVYSRGNTDFDNWLYWDIKYIDRMSFYLDVRIVLETFLRVALKRQKGAR
ncbi:MAG: sugar transferase [Anaerolineae bacterium]|nr:sugar transferase [Anaerolineae bacterium]